MVVVEEALVVTSGRAVLPEAANLLLSPTLANADSSGAGAAGSPGAGILYM